MKKGGGEKAIFNHFSALRGPCRRGPKNNTGGKEEIPVRARNKTGFGGELEKGGGTTFPCSTFFFWSDGQVNVRLSLSRLSAISRYGSESSACQRAKKPVPLPRSNITNPNEIATPAKSKTQELDLSPHSPPLTVQKIRIKKNIQPVLCHKKNSGKFEFLKNAYVINYVSCFSPG